MRRLVSKPYHIHLFEQFLFYWKKQFCDGFRAQTFHKLINGRSFTYSILFRLSEKKVKHVIWMPSSFLDICVTCYDIYTQNRRHFVCLWFCTIWDTCRLAPLHSVSVVEYIPLRWTSFSLVTLETNIWRRHNTCITHEYWHVTDEYIIRTTEL